MKKSLGWMGRTGWALLALVAVGAQAQTVWTNNVTGWWSNTASWVGGVVPAGGSNVYTIIVTNGTTVSVRTNNIADAGGNFFLNQFIFTNAGTTVTIYGGAGTNLVFTNNGATMPQYRQETSRTNIFNHGIMLATNTTFAGAGTGLVTINSNVVGLGSLTLNGSYTLALAASNAYSGGTILQSGTLQIGNANALGTGALTMSGGTFQSSATITAANNVTVGGNFTFGGSQLLTLSGTVDAGTGYTWTDNNTKTVTISGAITNSGGVTVAGTGTLLVFSGANTYGGATTINGSTLLFGNSNALPATSLITINTGGALAVTNNAASLYTTVNAWMTSGRIATNGAAGTFALTYSTGTEGIDFTSQNNSYSNFSLGAVGTVNYGGLITPANNTYRLGGSSGTLVITNDSALVDSSGARSLITSGAVTLTGSNSFSGGTTIGGGSTLTASNNNAFGTGPVYVLGSGNPLTLGSGLVFSNALVLADNNGGEQLQMVAAGTTTWAGPITLVDSNTTKGVRLDISANATLIINGVISGTNTAYFQIGRNTTGTVVLNNTNNYVSTTQIYGGTMRLGVDNAIPTNSTMQFYQNATLDLNGHNQTVAGLDLWPSGNSTSLITNSAAAPVTLTVLGNTTATFLGKLTDGTGGGTVALVLNGVTQILRFTNNTYSGGTTLSNGAMLVVGSTNSIGTGPLTSDAISGIGPTNQVDQTFLNWVTNKTTNVPGVILLGVNSTNSLTFGGSLSNAFLGAAGGAYTYSGSATWAADNSVRLGGGSSNLIYAAVMGAGTNLIVGPVGGNPAGIVTLVSNNTYGTTLINSGTLQIGNAGGTGTLGTGDVTNTSSLAFNRTGTNIVANNISGSGSLKQIGSGVTVLSGTNTYNNGTILSAGTLSIAAYTNLSVAGPLTFSGGTLQITGTTVANLDPYTVNWTNFSGGFDIASATNTLTISTNISGAGALTKAGAGTLTLSGVNTYTGVTTVNGGILTVTGTLSNGVGTTSIGSATGTKGLLYVPTGGSYTTTSFANGNNTNGVGSIVINGGTVTTTTATASAGLSSGAGGYGGLFVSGGSFTTHRLENNSTATSSVSVIQISGGTLISDEYIIFRNNRWEFTVTGGLVNHNGASKPISLGYQYAGIGAMTVAGGIVDNTGQTIELGHTAGTITASLNLNAGALITDGITTAGGAVSYVNFNGGTLRASAASPTFLPTGITAAYVNGAFGTNFAGGAVVDSNGKDITFAVPLLAPTGNGVSGLTLGSVGSGYIGAPYVDITGGGGSNATGYAVVDLNPASPTFGQLTGVVLSNPGVGYTNTPTINLLGGGGSGAGVTASGIVANTSGGLTKLGSGTLTLSGANTYTNGTTVSAGTLSFANTLAKPSVGTVNVLSNAALGLGVGGTGYFTSANVDALWANTLPGVNMDSNALVGIDTSASNFTYGTAQSTRGLVKLGANTLILTNANTYTGPTIISGGILQINTNSALGNGNVFNNATLAFNRSGAYSVTNPISGTGTNLLIGGGTLTPVRDDNLPITGAVTLGDTNSVGNLDLTSYSQTIAGLTVASTSSTLTNVLTIGAGQTLTVNGTGANFLLGGNVAATINTRLIATGGGALIITNGSYFESGRNNNANFGNAAIMDLSGLGAFTLSTTGTVHFGNDSGGTFSAGSTNVLAINNTISAAVLAVDQAGGSGTTRLLLGTGTNIFNVGALMVGSGTAAQSLRGHNAFLQFATNTGSILLRGPDGISAADMSIGIRRAQTCNSVVDFTGHYADLLIDTLDVGGINYSLVPGGQPTGSFAFDTGTAIVNQAQIGSLQNVSTNFGATGIVTIAGGYVAISNGVTMAINSGGVTTDARIVGYLNLYGGTINIGTNALGNSINMATGIGTNLAYVTITNGTVTLAGNIVKGGGANTNLASVTLNGGILDMTGHAIGDAINPIDSLTLQSGTLQNLGQFNGGAPLVKTGAGTLLLSGANFYTGGTTISNGTLAVGVNNALPPNTTLYADNLGSILDLNGHNQQVSGLSGAVGYRGTVNDSVGSGSLTLNFASGTNVLAGSLSGATSRFTLTGGGTLLLTGTNGFGTTVVSNGSTYVVNGRNDGGVITVYSASQLKGSGTIGAAVSVLAGGTLQAGNSPGLLTFTNGLTLAADSTNVWQLLGNSNASGLRGATNGYSAINVTGGNLFITTGSKIQLVFNATDSTVNWNDAFWNSNQTWHFVDITGGGASTNNYAFGDLVSTWLDVGGQTLTVARPSATFGASLDGSGNVLINYNAIPEPCTASLLGLIGVAFLVRRLRRRAQG